MGKEKDGGGDFKARIRDEMMVDYASALEKNFALAKTFVAITGEGKVEVLVKEKLTGKQQILLYLIGKLYAHEAGLAKTNDVGNKELMNELGMPKGSLLPGLKQLRDKKQIEQVKSGGYTHHRVCINLVAKILGRIEERVRKPSTGD